MAEEDTEYRKKKESQLKRRIGPAPATVTSSSCQSFQAESLSKIFAFSEQQAVKDHCLSDVVVVEVVEEEVGKKKKAKKTNKSEKKKTKKILVFSQEEEEKVQRFCIYALWLTGC